MSWHSFTVYRSIKPKGAAEWGANSLHHSATHIVTLSHCFLIIIIIDKKIIATLIKFATLFDFQPDLSDFVLTWFIRYNLSVILSKYTVTSSLKEISTLMTRAVWSDVENIQSMTKTNIVLRYKSFTWSLLIACPPGAHPGHPDG